MEKLSHPPNIMSAEQLDHLALISLQNSRHFTAMLKALIANRPDTALMSEQTRKRIIETHIANLQAHAILLDQLRQEAEERTEGTALEPLDTMRNTAREMLSAALNFFEMKKSPAARATSDVPMADRTPPLSPKYHQPTVEDIIEEKISSEFSETAARSNEDITMRKDSHQTRDNQSFMTSTPKRRRLESDDFESTTMAVCTAVSSRTAKRQRCTPTPETPHRKRKHSNSTIGDSDSPMSPKQKVPSKQSAKKVKCCQPILVDAVNGVDYYDDGNGVPIFIQPIQHEDISAEVDARIRAKDEAKAMEKERLRDRTTKRKVDTTHWIAGDEECYDGRKKRSRY